MCRPHFSLYHHRLTLHFYHLLNHARPASGYHFCGSDQSYFEQAIGIFADNFDG